MQSQGQGKPKRRLCFVIRRITFVMYTSIRTHEMPFSLAFQRFYSVFPSSILFVLGYGNPMEADSATWFR